MRSPRKVASPSSSKVETSKLTTTTTVRNQNVSPAVYEQRLQEIRDMSNPPQVTPTLSFGMSESALKNVKIITLPNEDHYEGDLNPNNEFHGFGRYLFRRENQEYQGLFENGLQNGRGKLYKITEGSYASYPGSDTSKFLIYDGEWKNGMKNGEGKYIYDLVHPDSHYYEGPWQNDERHGNLGTYVGPIGVYVGRWKHGKMHGKGKLTVGQTKTIYSGDFADNEFVRGVITYENGDEYNGEVKNGMRNDHQGRYVYQNFEGRSSLGSSAEKVVKYVGGWKEDIKQDQSGEATITYPEGQTLKGTFKEGKFVDSIRCTYQWPDRHNFNGWIKQQNGQYSFKGIVKGPQGEVYEV